jgi:hypothetical protein
LEAARVHDSGFLVRPKPHRGGRRRPDLQNKYANVGQPGDGDRRRVEGRPQGDRSPPGAFVEILPIRQKQMDYLRSTNKFPDFIDVGLDVWFAVHDWHVRHLQQPALGRDANGRYTISVMGTQLVMRPDLVPTFISAPYDSR